MEDLQCTCGHTIETGYEHMPYVGDVMPNRVFSKFFDKLEEIVESLIGASKAGTTETWMETNYPDAEAPGFLEEKNMFSFAFMNTYMDTVKPILQCDECGRIWIQRGDSGKYVAFKPEGGEWWGVLGV